MRLRNIFLKYVLEQDKLKGSRPFIKSFPYARNVDRQGSGELYANKIRLTRWPWQSPHAK